MERKIVPSLTSTTHVYSEHPNWGLGEVVGWTGPDSLDVVFENAGHRQLSYAYYHEKTGIDLCYVRLKDVNQLVEYLRERSVRYLVHFTHIDNVSSILENGILPRSEIKETGIVSDEVRLDSHEEYSCFSLTYPNYEMLYQKQKRSGEKYIILMVEIDALSEINEDVVLFYPGNAARKDMRSKGGRGVTAIELMFADSIITRGGVLIDRNAQKLESEYTTDPQAEVQIKSSIPARYIKQIFVSTATMRDAVNSKTAGSDITVELCPEMFWPVHYWEDYESKRKLRKEVR